MNAMNLLALATGAKPVTPGQTATTQSGQSDAAPIGFMSMFQQAMGQTGSLTAMTAMSTQAVLPGLSLPNALQQLLQTELHTEEGTAESLTAQESWMPQLQALLEQLEMATNGEEQKAVMAAIIPMLQHMMQSMEKMMDMASTVAPVTTSLHENLAGTPSSMNTMMTSELQALQTLHTQLKQIMGQVEGHAEQMKWSESLLKEVKTWLADLEKTNPIVSKLVTTPWSDQQQQEWLTRLSKLVANIAANDQAGKAEGKAPQGSEMSKDAKSAAGIATGIVQGEQTKNQPAHIQPTAEPVIQTEVQSNQGKPLQVAFADTMVKAAPATEISSSSAEQQASSAKMNVKEFADEMMKMVRSMQFQQQQGISEAKIRLMPEHLGHVEVRISMQNGMMTAQFVADTIMGRDALEQQMVQFRHQLQQQGIQVDKIEVTQSSLFGNLNQNQQQFAREGQAQQQGTKLKKGSYEEVDVFDWDETVIRSESTSYYGSTFQAKA
ncbi:flagellar hook-length control protein FliK [Marinicrinis sediminis]|uniref:Flagellar hook-length control protein FliK n=1 Tax=Marinicrinis sediminis TaxID=1652465 RepID=A0ABW5R5V9_9BACL